MASGAPAAGPRTRLGCPPACPAGRTTALRGRRGAGGTRGAPRRAPSPAQGTRKRTSRVPRRPRPSPARPARPRAVVGCGPGAREGQRGRCARDDAHLPVSRPPALSRPRRRSPSPPRTTASRPSSSRRREGTARRRAGGPPTGRRPPAAACAAARPTPPAPRPPGPRRHRDPGRRLGRGRPQRPPGCRARRAAARLRGRRRPTRSWRAACRPRRTWRPTASAWWTAKRLGGWRREEGRRGGGRVGTRPPTPFSPFSSPAASATRRSWP